MKKVNKRLLISILLGTFLISGANFVIQKTENPINNLKEIQKDSKALSVPGWSYRDIKYFGINGTYTSVAKVVDDGTPYYKLETIFLVDDSSKWTSAKFSDRTHATEKTNAYATGDYRDVRDRGGWGPNQYRTDIHGWSKSESTDYYSWYDGWGNSYRSPQWGDSEQGLYDTFGVNYSDFNSDSDHAFSIYKKLNASVIDGDEAWKYPNQKVKVDYLKSYSILLTDYTKAPTSSSLTGDWYADKDLRDVFSFREITVGWSPSEITNAPKFGGTIYLQPSINVIDPEHLLLNAKLKEIGVRSSQYNLGEVKFNLHNDQTTVDYGGAQKYDIQPLDQEIIINKKDGSGKHDGKIWINGKESTNPLYDSYIENRLSEPNGENDNFITRDQDILDEGFNILLSNKADDPDKDKWNIINDAPENGRLIFWPEVDYNLTLTTEVSVTKEGISSGMLSKDEVRKSTLNYPYDVQQPVFTQLDVKNDTYDVYPFIDGNDSTYVSNEIEFLVDTQTVKETATLPTAKPTELKKLELVSRPVGGSDSDWVISSDAYTFNQADFDVNTGFSKHLINLKISDQILKAGETREFAIQSTYAADSRTILSRTLELSAPSMDALGEGNIQEWGVVDNTYHSVDDNNGLVDLNVKLDTVSTEEADPIEEGHLATGVNKIEILKEDGTVIQTREIDDSKITSEGLINETFSVNVDRQNENTYKLKIYSDAGIYTSTNVLKFTTPAPSVKFKVTDLVNSDFIVINDSTVSTNLSFSIDGTTIAESDAMFWDEIATKVNSIVIKGLGSDITIDNPTADKNGKIDITTDPINLTQGKTYDVKVVVNYDELNGTTLTNQSQEVISTSITTPGVNDSGITNEEASGTRSKYTPPTSGDKGVVSYDIDYSFDTTSEKEIVNPDGTLNAPMTITQLELYDVNTKDVLETQTSAQFTYNPIDGTVKTTFRDVQLLEATDYTLGVRVTWNYSNEPTVSKTHESTKTFTTWEAGVPTKPTDITFTKEDFVNEVDADGKETGKLSTTFNYSFDTTTYQEYVDSNYEDGETNVTGIKVTSSLGGSIAEDDLTSHVDANGLYTGELTLSGIDPLKDDVTFTLSIDWENGTEDSSIIESTPAIGVMKIDKADIKATNVQTSYSSIQMDLSILDGNRSSELDRYEDYILDEVKVVNAAGDEFTSEVDVNTYTPEAGLDTSILITGLQPSNNDGNDTFANQINEGGYKLVISTVDGQTLEKDITVVDSTNSINIGDDELSIPTTEKPGDLKNIITGVEVDPTSITTSGSFDFQVVIEADETFDIEEFNKIFNITDENGNVLESEPLTLVTGNRAATEKVYSSSLIEGQLDAGEHTLTASYKVFDNLVGDEVNVEYEMDPISIPEAPKDNSFPWWIIIVILLLVLSIVGAALAVVFVVLPWSIVSSETKVQTGNKASITINKKHDVVKEKLKGTKLNIEGKEYKYSISKNDKDNAVINIEGITVKDGLSNIKFSGEKDIKVKGTIKK